MERADLLERPAGEAFALYSARVCLPLEDGRHEVAAATVEVGADGRIAAVTRGRHAGHACFVEVP